MALLLLTCARCHECVAVEYAARPRDRFDVEHRGRTYDLCTASCLAAWAAARAAGADPADPPRAGDEGAAVHVP